jgi:hypothetical protein
MMDRDAFHSGGDAFPGGGYAFQRGEEGGRLETTFFPIPSHLTGVSGWRKVGEVRDLRQVWEELLVQPIDVLWTWRGRLFSDKQHMTMQFV